MIPEIISDEELYDTNLCAAVIETEFRRNQMKKELPKERNPWKILFLNIK